LMMDADKPVAERIEAISRFASSQRNLGNIVNVFRKKEGNPSQLRIRADQAMFEEYGALGDGTLIQDRAVNVAINILRNKSEDSKLRIYLIKYHFLFLEKREPVTRKVVERVANDPKENPDVIEAAKKALLVNSSPEYRLFSVMMDADKPVAERIRALNELASSNSKWDLANVVYVLQNKEGNPSQLR